MEHIRELRNRVIKIALALIVGMAVGWFLYPHVWHFIQAPYCRAHFATHLPGQANGPNSTAACTSPASSTRSSCG